MGLSPANETGTKLGTRVIDLRILGPLKLSASDGRDVDAVARQPKRAALLAYLAAARPLGLHRRDHLLTLFWPEADQPRARAALSQAVYVLRTELGEPAIVTRGDEEVGLDPDHVWCDAVRFEAALDAGSPADALALYRGDLLAGFHVTGVPEFELWMDRERDRLRQRASEGAWALAESTAPTDPIGAARWARRAAELLPADEAVVRRLMSFLHRLGDRAAAVRAYEAYAWNLAHEYELEPSTETQSLAGAIRREPQRASWTLAPASVLAADHGSARRNLRPLWLGVSIAIAAVLGAAGWIVLKSDALPSPVVRVALEFTSPALGSSVAGSTLALSPDGKWLAYLVSGEDGTRIFLRPLDQPHAVPVLHTQGASQPFFAPDGAWLGFVAGGRIRKVPLDGGPAITVTNLDSNMPGASWGSNDVIVFAGGSALWRVPATGGKAQVFARPDSGSGEVYRWPHVLPGGRAAVFTIVDSTGFRLAVVSLESGSVQDLGVEGTSPYFVAPNYLIFARPDGALLGVLFDPSRLEITGPVFPVTDGVMVGIAGAAKVSLSRSGILVYVPESAEDRALVMVDRHGIATPVPVAPRGFFAGGRFSPDGGRIAVGTEAAGEGLDIWLIDLLRGSLSRVTWDSGSVVPVWSRDGARLAFGTKPRGRLFGFEIRWSPTNARGAAETLLPSEVSQLPGDFTPDGRALLFERNGTSTSGDIWLLPLVGDRTPRPYLRTRFDERGPAVSPDGHWVAYVSDELGSDEVYVGALSTRSSSVRVSRGGGREPRWAPDGRELFYRDSRGMVAVDVALTTSFRAGSTHVLFHDDEYLKSDRQAAYDVHPDGQRFLMTRRGAASDQAVVLLNWLPLRDRH